MRLFIIKNKFEIIKVIKYSMILKDLEHYFDLISYLHNNVYYYTQLTQSFQILKTSLLK